MTWQHRKQVLIWCDSHCSTANFGWKGQCNCNTVRTQYVKQALLYLVLFTCPKYMLDSVCLGVCIVPDRLRFYNISQDVPKRLKQVRHLNGKKSRRNYLCMIQLTSCLFIWLRHTNVTTEITNNNPSVFAA